MPLANHLEQMTTSSCSQIELWTRQFMPISTMAGTKKELLSGSSMGLAKKYYFCRFFEDLRMPPL